MRDFSGNLKDHCPSPGRRVAPAPMLPSAVGEDALVPQVAHALDEEPRARSKL